MTDTYTTAATAFDPSETGAVAELARLAAEVDEPIEGLLVGHRQRLDNLDLEAHLDRPRRARGTTTVDSPEALNTLVERWHTPAAADVNVYYRTAPVGGLASIVAVLNDHAAADGPGHRDLRVEHIPRLSEPWKAWADLLGTPLNQRQFGEHIEDRLDTIAAPAAADLLDVVTTFATTTTVRFASAVNLQNGLRRLTYTEDDNGAESGSAGNLTVPDRITLVLPIYDADGADTETVTIGVRYAVVDGSLKIVLRLLDAAATYRQANDNYLALLDADLTVLAGTA